VSLSHHSGIPRWNRALARRTVRSEARVKWIGEKPDDSDYDRDESNCPPIQAESLLGEVCPSSQGTVLSLCTVLLLRQLFRIIGHALKVDGDDCFVSDNPRIVPWGNQRDVASLAVSLCAIIHDHMQCSRYLVLEMRSFTALCLCDRLDVSGPSPSRLEHSSPDRRFADLHKLKFSLFKRSCLVGSIRTLDFHFAQCSSNHMHNWLATGREYLFTKPQKEPHP